MLRLTTLLLAVSIFAFGQGPKLDLVNGSWDEQAPVLSPDGRLLYFTVAKSGRPFEAKLDPVT